MADNTTPRGFISYPNKGDTSWYSSDPSGDGLTDWLAAIELFGIPTYQSFSDLPTAGNTETNGNQRQFAAVIDDRTVYRDDGSSWVPWFGTGTSSRSLGGTTYLNALETDTTITSGGDISVNENKFEALNSDTNSTQVGFDLRGDELDASSPKIQLESSVSTLGTFTSEIYNPGGPLVLDNLSGGKLSLTTTATLEIENASINMVDSDSIQDAGTDAITLDGSANPSVANGHLETSGGIEYQQRGDPTTSELADGQCMEYCSDGSGTGSAGDLVYAVNDSGTIKTSIIAQRSNAT